MVDRVTRLMDGVDTLSRRMDTVSKKGSFWSYQAASDTPRFESLPEGCFSGSKDQWESLSPGMRREIVRSFEKLKLRTP